MKLLAGAPARISSKPGYAKKWTSDKKNADFQLEMLKNKHLEPLKRLHKGGGPIFRLYGWPIEPFWPGLCRRGPVEIKNLEFLEMNAKNRSFFNMNKREIREIFKGGRL